MKKYIQSNRFGLIEKSTAWRNTRCWWGIVSLQVLHSTLCHSIIECSVRRTCTPLSTKESMIPFTFNCCQSVFLVVEKWKCFGFVSFAPPHRRSASRDCTKNNVVCHVFNIFSWFRCLFLSLRVYLLFHSFVCSLFANKRYSDSQKCSCASNDTNEHTTSLSKWFVRLCTCLTFCPLSLCLSLSHWLFGPT